MRFTTLEDFPIETLTDCFNGAFSDYIIKFFARPEHLKARWKRGRVDLSLSGGALGNETLAGFIISGRDEWKGQLTAYNAATGVIPSARGQQITQKLYDFLIPRFLEKGMQQCTLEVIQRNDVAVHVYEKIGFRKERALLCFSGVVKQESIKPANNCSIRKIEKPDWDVFESFWDYMPSWEHTRSAVEIAGDQIETWGIYDGELKGYAMKMIQSGYIAQFGIKKEDRGKGYGGSLFQKLSQINETLVVNNVDSRSEATLNFLHKIGLQNKINQYEMIMEI